MRELTGGDLNRPIVAAGWNSECFDGRNLALRLLAPDYTNVYWYRGGREAWEVAGLPETELSLRTGRAAGCWRLAFARRGAHLTAFRVLKLTLYRWTQGA
jgi:hypothetical protein